jgi:toxin-antitoxin system PIN domain toxin
VILVDANLLLYAQDSLSEFHVAARTWWDAQLSGSEPVGLCWPVMTAFIRIATNPRLYENPLTTREASDAVQTWLEQACVRVIQPTEAHWSIFQQMLEAANATANMVPDAHLAALAVEHQCVLCSTDGDPARFPEVRWQNPLSVPGG